jgi:nucleoside-diphosphate-sugar epimerase
MRVLIAGATGVIGRQLIPLLAAVDHEVIAVSRSRGGTARLPGVQVHQADLLDRTAIAKLAADCAPDAVVHLATAIPAAINPKRFDRDMALTNRLRTEGTANLLDAASETGTTTIITESLAYAYEPGAGLADEDAHLWHKPPREFAAALAALVELEARTRAADGLVLRFGHLYGPGSAYAPDGSITEQVKARKMPVAGNGESVFSFIHARDAATAIVAALDQGATGVLNVVDDEPAPLREWLPGFARLLDAPAPPRAPAAVVRLLAGGWGAAFMTRLRGADNSRARLLLGWRPRYQSWRQGFPAQ